jgi:hypothetical protein
MMVRIILISDSSTNNLYKCDGDSNQDFTENVSYNEIYSTYYAKYPWSIVKNQKLGCGICRNVQKLPTYKTQGIK